MSTMLHHRGLSAVTRPATPAGSRSLRIFQGSFLRGTRVTTVDVITDDEMTKRCVGLLREVEMKLSDTSLDGEQRLQLLSRRSQLQQLVSDNQVA